jgi:serine phosphatase RsbU (regulator of sigma subunit)
MEIRTRQFPVIFAVAGVLFAGLFIAFYLLVFDSINGIFAAQERRTLESLVEDISAHHQTVLRETKILHRSRGIQRRFAGMAGERPGSDVVKSLQRHLLDWHAQISETPYRAASYLNARYEPVAVVDFHKDGNLASGNADREIEAVYSTAGGEEETVIENPILIRSWVSKPPIQSGTYVLSLGDSTQVLRTISPIIDRRSKEAIGHFAIDRLMESAWNPEGQELLIVDSNGRHIVHSSSSAQAAGYPADRFYSHIEQAFDGEEEGALATATLTHTGNELLLNRLIATDPAWELTTILRLNPYTEGPRFRGRLLIFASLLFVAIAGFSIYALTLRVRRRSEALEEANAELEQANEVVSEHNRLLAEELQTAHDLQMRLMPQENPTVSGFDIVGRCRPATEVGGDFYQYFPVEDERVVIALADVTGHGMQAAIPAMVFSGLLDTQINYSTTPEELMPRLNASLYRVLEPRTFVCLSLGELDPQQKRLRLSNGGCPYPFLYREANQQVEEIDLSAFPLGVRAESTYEVEEVQLDQGDIVVMCSDGIIEAGNRSGELYGFERVAESIRQAGMQQMNAQELLNFLFGEVEQFARDSEQTDDQTIVVIRADESAARLN